MKFEMNKAISEEFYLEGFCEKLFKENNIEEPFPIKGMPQRMVFENKIWNIGEIIRTEITKNKSKRTDNLKNGIVNIIRNIKYKKGRESFVMLIHLFKQDDNTVPLFEFILNDRDIYGFGIAELNKIKLYAFSEKIEEIFKVEKTGWIKREIKKFQNNK